MKVIDPTYLRSIQDGLISGTVHKDNTSALPLGLMGMYETAAPPSSHVSDRKKFLEFFGIWALLKKEVSVDFVVSLLAGWSEDLVVDYIARYSKWFNSPKSGKYILYHERLRTFVLQKITHTHFSSCNQAIIQLCQNALSSQIGDEMEHYALEHLSKHLLIQAMENKDASSLKMLAYNNSHWNRQVEISKGFEWSKHLLHDMMLWASKYDEEEVIECLLTKVDLNHLEQNDAPRIVELVAQNDIETALQRIETFGGNDQEGLQRKFILYVLCLMELTLLESKDKPFRKEAIEKLLKHLDDNLPVDHSVLNWNDFFPSYLMFQMACELKRLMIDFYPALNKTNGWDLDWIDTKGPYSDKEFNLLNRVLNTVTNKEKKLKYTKLILCEYCKQNKENKIKVLISKITKNEFRDEIIEVLVAELVKIGKLDFLLSLKKLIEEESDQNRFLLEIIVQLLKENQINRAKNLFSQFSYKYYKVAAICLICNYLYDKKIGDYLSPLNMAIDICKSIQSDSWLLMAKRKIASTYIHQRKFLKAQKIIQESFNLNINSEDLDDFCLSSLVQNFAEAGKFDFAEKLADKIRNCSERNFSYAFLSKELLKMKKFDVAYLVFKKIIIEDGYSYRWETFLINASKELLETGKIKTALEIVGKIDSMNFKSDAYVKISEILFKQKKHVDAIKALEKAIEYNLYSENYLDKVLGIKGIIFLLLKYKKEEEALVLANKVIDDFWGVKNEIKIEFSKYFAYKGELNNAFQYISQLEDLKMKNKAMLDVLNIISFCNIKDPYHVLLVSLRYHVELRFIENPSDQLKKITHGLIERNCIDVAYDCARNIQSSLKKSYALLEISSALFQKGDEKFNKIFNESIIVANVVENHLDKILLFKSLSIERRLQGNSDQADSLLLESLEFVRQMEWPWNFMSLSELMPEFFKWQDSGVFIEYVNILIEESFDDCGLLIDISVEWAKRGEIKKALSCARDINSDVDKIHALAKISTILYKQDKRKDSILIVEEALEVSNSIDEDSIRCEALRQISIELMRQGQVDASLSCSRSINMDEYKIQTLVINISELVYFDRFFEAEIVLNEALDLPNSIADELKNHESIDYQSIIGPDNRILNEILLFARKLSPEKEKNQVLLAIATKLAVMGNLQLAEEIGMEISEVADRGKCFEVIFNDILKGKGWKEALEIFAQIKNKESQNYFLKVLLTSLFSIEINKEFILRAQRFFQENIGAVEKLLQNYALHELFFGQSAPENIQRFNRTLNIQWAIDTKNQLMSYN